MTRHSMIRIILLFILALITCSNKPARETRLAGIGFYSTPEDQIKKLDTGNAGYRENFILGGAYKKLKKYKKSISCFASSCFKNARFSRDVFTSGDIIVFLKSKEERSEYYNDSLLEIADLYSLYNVPADVIEILNLMKPDESGAYIESIILKATNLDKLKMYDRGIAILEDSYRNCVSNESKSMVLLKTALLLEKKGINNRAAAKFIDIMNINPQSWHSSLAAKRLLQIIQGGQVPVRGISGKVNILKSFYFSKLYSGGLKIAELIGQQGGADELDYLKIQIRLLTRNNAGKKSAAILGSLRNERNTYFELLYERADELWKMGDIKSSLPMYREIIDSKIEPVSEKSLRQLCNHYADTNKYTFRSYLPEYISRYRDQKPAGYYLWILGRDELLLNRYDAASQFFMESIKQFPQGSYSDQCRFWLYKISTFAGDQKSSEAIARELLFMNPESSLAWDVLKKIEKDYTEPDLEKKFRSSKPDAGNTGQLLYHSLLLLKEKSFVSRDRRIQSMTHPVLEQYQKLKKILDPEGPEMIRSLEKYFIIGNMDYIERELRTLPDGVDSRIRKNVTLSVYGKLYRQPYLSARSVAALLRLRSIPEIIQLIPKELLHYLYPTAFSGCVIDASKQFGIDQNIIYSVMRSESLYKHTAVSTSNAVGLMQLLPSTAAGIAKTLKKSGYNLKDPCTSLQFGTLYLSWLNKSFDSNIPLTLAGYNGGPNFIKRSYQKTKYRDFDLYIESIPMLETRLYVIRTIKHILVYELINGNNKGTSNN